MSDAALAVAVEGNGKRSESFFFVLEIVRRMGLVHKDRQSLGVRHSEQVNAVRNADLTDTRGPERRSNRKSIYK